MLQVKIIRCTGRLMESQINEFLQRLGSQPGIKVSVPDIKVNYIGGKEDTEEALIIYNTVRVPTESE